MTVSQCQHIKDPNHKFEAPVDINEKDDDDFDDDEDYEDEDEKVTKSSKESDGLKVHDIVKLYCSMLHKANDNLDEYFVE